MKLLGTLPLRHLRPSVLTAYRLPPTAYFSLFEQRRGAERFEDAFAAERGAGLADLAAVGDEEVREEHPVALGDEFHEVALDLLGRGVRGEREASGEARDVRIDDDAGGDAEGVAEDDVRRLARDAGEPEQLLHPLGHAPAVVREQHAARALNRLRLVAEEAGRADVVLKLGGGRVRVVLAAPVLAEQAGGDEV